MSLLAATTKRTLFAPTQASGVTAANVFSFESRRYASRKRWLAKVDASMFSFALFKNLMLINGL